MSKRFGRTQRRKMRAEMDALKYQLATTSHSLKRSREECQHLLYLYRDLMENVEQTFGEYSVLLPPKEMAARQQPPGLHFSLPKREMSVPYLAQAGAQQLAELHYSTVNMLEVKVDMEERQDIPGHHIRLRLPNGKCLYYITDNVMSGAYGCPHEVRRQLVKMVAEAFDRALRNGVPG